MGGGGGGGGGGIEKNTVKRYDLPLKTMQTSQGIGSVLQESKDQLNRISLLPMGRSVQMSWD